MIISIQLFYDDDDEYFMHKIILHLSYQIFVLCQSFDMSKQCPKICFEMSNVFGHPTRTTANLDVCSIYMVYLCLMRLMPILPQWAKTRKKDFILFVRTFTLLCIPICLKNAADQYALIYATRTISILKLWSLPIWLFYRFVLCEDDAVERRRWQPAGQPTNNLRLMFNFDEDRPFTWWPNWIKLRQNVEPRPSRRICG